MLRFTLLGSGSSGNAVFVAGPSSKILIDNGLSLKQLETRLAAVGETLDGLQGVFVTHEHIDHVRGLGVLSRKRKPPIYITEPTFERLPETVGEVSSVEHFEAGDSLQMGDLTVTSYSVSHDAADPVGYVVSCGGAKLGLAADLGHVSMLVRQRLAGSHALILESNYCPNMLLKGSYPEPVKQRIRSKHGHLSNADSNSLLSELIHDGLRLVVLAHISEENNEYEHARMMAAQVLRGHDIALHVARQGEPTPVFTVAP